MRSDKITEFVTVLVSAMVVAAGASLAILYLDGFLRVAALVILVAATITAWQYLRKRFGRR